MFNDMKKTAVHLLSENAAAILTAGGVIGTVATAVLTGQASVKAFRLIEEEQQDLERQVYVEAPETKHDQFPQLTTMAKIKVVWPQFIPPVLVGGATIGSIVMANRMSAQKAAALAAVYGLSQKQLEEYKEKVSEKLTPAKKQQLEDELAQDRVNRTPGHNQIVILGNDVICFDEPTGRYFQSTMEKIQRAVNSTNAEILRHNYASASYFYDELEMKPTTWSNEVGWGLGQTVDLKITTTKTPDEKPCLSIDFKTLPMPNHTNPYS